ncbi:MAG: ribokinase [Bacteroidales bacterium]|nr:ribokinase [Bacteroidales bacterium]MBN2764371.1 ribokinase [Bacteroidales bacterium]
MKITVVGSSNADMIIKVPRLPVAGETVMGGNFSVALGGKGANQAVAAARMGGNVTFIGRFGDDVFGKQALNGLKEDGINTDLTVIDSSVPTGIAEIMVDDEGRNIIAVAPGANQNLCENDIANAQKAILASDILLLQMEVPMQTVRFSAKLAFSNNIRVILNPAPAHPLDDELLGYISVLTPNKLEAETLTGISITDERSVELAGRILLERGLMRVIITLGEKGSMVIDNGGAEHVPAFRIKSIDTTAASDVFNGALAVALSEGKNFYESVRFANAAAAISATRLGAQPSIPGRDEVMEMLRKNP